MFFKHDELELFLSSCVVEEEFLLRGPLVKTNVDNRIITEVLTRVCVYILDLPKLIGELQFHILIVSYTILLKTSPMFITR